MIYLYNNEKSSGCYGGYFKHFNKGVKIIYETKSAYINNIYYRLETNESLDVIIESIFFNIYYGKMASSVDICKKNNEYFLAIKMPHFYGKPLSNSPKSYFLNKKGKITKKTTSNPLAKQIASQLGLKNLFHHDLHGNNILVHKGEPKVIDFSPELTQYYGTKREFQKHLTSTLNDLYKTIYESIGRKLNKKKIRMKIMKKVFK